MNTKIKILSVSLLAILLIIGCKKKTVTGPAGPQGVQGINGNANVTNTTFTVTNWTATGYAYASDNLYVPSLDLAILTSGLILVYYQTPSNIYNLPFNNGTYMIAPEFGLNSLRIYSYRNDHAIFPDPSGGSAMIFRIVTIPSSIKKANPEINYNNYKAVAEAFNLKD